VDKGSSKRLSGKPCTKAGKGQELFVSQLRKTNRRDQRIQLDLQRHYALFRDRYWNE